MIVVNVEDYCQACLDFTPDVTPPAKVYSDNGEYVLGDTVIYCKYRKRCAGIKRFLEQQAKEEASG